MKTAAFIIASLFLLVPLASAEHVQSSSFERDEATFDHVKGNEWWVEVHVEHTAGLTGVEARDDGGDWVPLEKKDWGPWAGSFHIEPGHDVRFRAVFEDSFVTSCWFSHPEGKERCTSAWHTTIIDRAGQDVFLSGQVVADVDNDGSQELVTATEDGLRFHRYDGGWHHQDTLAAGETFSDPAAGDLDGDGRTDIVAEVFGADRQFTRFEFDGTWQRMDYTGPARGGSALTVGDPDDDGVDAVYMAPHGADAPVYEIRLVDGAWHEEVIAGVSEGVDVLHVGDGNGDGDDELYAGGGYKGDDSLFQIEHGVAGWSKTQIGTEHGSNSVFDISTGDVDGDGRDELYHSTSVIAEPHALWRNTFDGTWSQVRVSSFGGQWYPQAVEVADADNDGRDEVYVGVRGQDDHRVQKIEFDGGAFTKQRIAVLDGGGDPVLRSGDIDGDGLTELYVIEERWNGFIHEVSQHPPGGDSDGGSGGFDASFSTPGGNEWWVEVYVDANEPLAGVDARDDGGAWTALEKQDWGAWAKSFHVEDGSLVDFRATSTDGDTDISGQYRWPDGTQVTQEPDDGDEEPSPEPSAEVAFGPKASNEWWIETMVIADGTIDTVEARADGGTWHTLEHKDWGAYAASFHAPEGSIVEFRATLSDGSQSVSDGFVWPQAEIVGGDGSWPEEGSYARFAVQRNSPAGAYDYHATYIFHEGGWLVQCEGTVTLRGSTNQYGEFMHEAPPASDSSTGPRQVQVATIGSCGQEETMVTVSHVDQTRTHRNGEDCVAETWFAGKAQDGTTEEVEFSTYVDLVTDWMRDGADLLWTGHVEDTDAPLRCA